MYGSALLRVTIFFISGFAQHGRRITFFGAAGPVARSGHLNVFLNVLILRSLNLLALVPEVRAPLGVPPLTGPSGLVLVGAGAAIAVAYAPSLGFQSFG